MKKRFLALAIVLAIIAAMIVPMAVSAASVQVGPGKTYTDIQSGITAAGASGTVTVFPGTYTITSPIVVPNGVTIDGPNAGINPNTGTRGAEAIITSTMNGNNSTPIFSITSTSAVTIDGFDFNGIAADVVDSSAACNLTFQNNIVQNVTNGGECVFIWGPPFPASLTFNNNLFENYKASGGSNAYGEILRCSGGGTTVLTVESNVFNGGTPTLGDGVTAMNISGCKSTIENNTFENLIDYGILLADNSTSTITGNTFNNIQNPNAPLSGNLYTDGAGIRFYNTTGSGPVTINGNTFSNSYTGIGVRIGDTDLGATISNNTFGPGNQYNIVNMGSGAIDADYNFWGAGATATSIGNSIGGTGAALVTYLPFSVNGGTVTVSGLAVGPSVTMSAPGSFNLNGTNGAMGAGWNTGTAAPGNVTFTQGTDGAGTWTVTAQSGSPFMTNGTGTPLTDYLLIGKTSISGPWFIANGGSGTVGGTGMIGMTGLSGPISGALTYNGSALTAPLNFYAAQFITSSDTTLGNYTNTITFTATCMP
jgi:parallel beta-helix repeat protein